MRNKRPISPIGSLFAVFNKKQAAQNGFVLEAACRIVLLYGIVADNLETYLEMQSAKTVRFHFLSSVNSGRFWIAESWPTVFSGFIATYVARTGSWPFPAKGDRFVLPVADAGWPVRQQSNPEAADPLLLEQPLPAKLYSVSVQGRVTECENAEAFPWTAGVQEDIGLPGIAVEIPANFLCRAGRSFPILTTFRSCNRRVPAEKGNQCKSSIFYSPTVVKCLSKFK